MKNTNMSFFNLFPIMIAFCVMGFIDIVGVATSYVKEQYELSDKYANLLPSMALVWFFLISLPTGIMMSRIGRKNTVLLSLLITTIAMPICFIGNNFYMVLLSFVFLGIGNTIMQVSINPFLSNVVDSKHVTSAITFGQFLKSVVSSVGPILISIAAVKYGDWRFLFIVYTIISAFVFIWLSMTKVKREVLSDSVHLGYCKIFSMLKDSYLLICFTLIFFAVGIEISLMTIVPKYLKEIGGFSLEKGSLACSIFYFAKMTAAFAGSFILARFSSMKYLIISLWILICAFICFILFSSYNLLIISLIIMGLAIANIFSVVISLAMQHNHDHANEISALMITAIAGGALLPFLVGIVSDVSSQRLSLFIPLISSVYMLFGATFLMKKSYRR